MASLAQTSHTAQPPRTVYQKYHSFADRSRASAALRRSKPDWVPIVCEPATNRLQDDETVATATMPAPSTTPATAASTARSRTAASELAPLLMDPRHQLVRRLSLSRATSVSMLIDLLRPMLVLDDTKAIFLMIGAECRVLPVTSRPIGDIYDAYKDADGYLYVLYSVENTYG